MHTGFNSLALQRLDPHKIKAQGVGRGLFVQLNDGPPIEANLVRTFPLSQPDVLWSLYDSAGQEIGIIVDPAELSPDVQRVFQAELERRYFMPVIKRVHSVAERLGNLEWSVETDRGPREFTTQLLREVTIQPSPFRYLISDNDGNRYDVTDIRLLDVKSRLSLMAYL